MESTNIKVGDIVEIVDIHESSGYFTFKDNLIGLRYSVGNIVPDRRNVGWLYFESSAFTKNEVFGNYKVYIAIYGVKLKKVRKLILKKKGKKNA